MTLEQFKSCIYDFFKTLPSNEVEIFIKKTEKHRNKCKSFEEFIKYYYNIKISPLECFILSCFTFDNNIYIDWNHKFRKFYTKYLNEIQNLWKD